MRFCFETGGLAEFAKIRNCLQERGESLLENGVKQYHNKTGKRRGSSPKMKNWSENSSMKTKTDEVRVGTITAVALFLIC